ncbi:MAG TPA: sulfotransferase [Rhodanobacteraceae bacterium]|nr:sulfotransferase [Rhodanobacteraceae bacterium]
MGVNDRLFAPPVPDATKVEARLAMLPPRIRTLIKLAGAALESGNLPDAQRALADALAAASAQPDVLRLYGSVLAQIGNFPAASANFEAALCAAPDDALTYCQFARVCEDAGDIDAALRLREQAVARLPDSPLAWGDLGEHLFQYRGADASLAPLERATQLAPDYAPAQLKFGDALVSCGRAEEGAAAIRRALRAEPAFGAAWLSLSDIKTVPVTVEEAARIRELLRSNDLDESEHTAVEFALARVCEGAGSCKEAFDLLLDANARRKRELRPWPRAQFLEQVRKNERVFAAPHRSAENPTLGRDIVFIVGMPRSGTTLVEQILASHPQVRGAGELGDLAQVLTEESTARQRRYPEWVPAATAQDWQRLGRRYLALTARWRKERPHSTDKMPNNWQAFGAIRAMLPGARIVVCRRDPLENCWSCFKQFFPSGWEFTYDLDQLGEFWKAFDRAASQWAQRSPDHVREQCYEAMTENPESEIRALLDFCRLPFDPACLRFHDTRRSVQTLSAAQVRQPMQRHAATAAGYGALLDPLRVALGLAPVGRVGKQAART